MIVSDYENILHSVMSSMAESGFEVDEATSRRLLDEALADPLPDNPELWEAAV